VTSNVRKVVAAAVAGGGVLGVSLGLGLSAAGAATTAHQTGAVHHAVRLAASSTMTTPSSSSTANPSTSTHKCPNMGTSSGTGTSGTGTSGTGTSGTGTPSTSTTAYLN